MPDTYDLIVLGSGPGGYVAAIRAAQLGLKTAIVERELLGGICLNWGCIPTKALLRTAEVWHNIQEAEAFGLSAGEPSFDLKKVVTRSRQVAGQLNGGVKFLMKKNKVTVVEGSGTLKGDGRLAVAGADGTVDLEAGNIIIATGARARVADTVSRWLDWTEANRTIYLGTIAPGEDIADPDVRRVDADLVHRIRPLRLDRFELGEQAVRDLRAAHADEPLDLRHVRDRHDPRDDRHLDAHRAGLVAEAVELGVVEEELRDDEVGAVVDLALQVLHVAREIQALRMPFGIAGHADAEIMSAANVFHERVGIGKSAFGRNKVRLPRLRIAA